MIYKVVILVAAILFIFDFAKKRSNYYRIREGSQKFVSLEDKPLLFDRRNGHFSVKMTQK